MLMKKSLFALGTIALACAPALVSADSLTSVPIIGGMIMPMVSYHAADAMMHVMMPPDIPQLTPLLISYPTNHFDPADPWFDALDSSRQGLSFSRRYGFMMDPGSDPLPPGAQMWIRLLSSSPQLQFHSVSTGPRTFIPIFGTDGATNALYWDGVMFHPVVTAPPGANGFTATFQVYLVDTAIGQEVANSASAPFELDWTDVPDGRPKLELSATQAGNIVVAWPSATATNWLLESANSPNASVWTAVTNAPSNLDGQPCVILDPATPQQFFRMRYVP